jgi:hypothetical protein
VSSRLKSGTVANQSGAFGSKLEFQGSLTPTFKAVPCYQEGGFSLRAADYGNTRSPAVSGFFTAREAELAAIPDNPWFSAD